MRRELLAEVEKAIAARLPLDKAVPALGTQPYEAEAAAA